MFNLTNPNGVWSLYVVDDTGGDTGSISNGWLLALTVPTIFTVNSTADPGNGVCDATECTLREAINAAIANTGNGDLINFSSLFNTPQTINLMAALPVLNEFLTIQGPGANLLTVRRDDNAPAFRIFTISGGIADGVAISGMTITGGSVAGDDFGGGIFSFSYLALTGIHVTGNAAGSGGGVDLSYANGVFTNCSFSSNSSTWPSGEGGGIYFLGDEGHTLRLISSTVDGNHSAFNGGGIGHGSFGGNSRLEITNGTITNNRAAFGGGILTFTVGASTATTTLRNTIVAGNSPNNLGTQIFSGGGAPTFQTLGFNLSDNYNGVVTTLGTDKTGQPLLGPFSLIGGQTPTHALLFGSPALDAGDPSGLATDQRGLARVFGASADIGAVEMRSLIVSNANNSGLGSLRQAIIDANANGSPLDDIIFDPAIATISLLTVLPDISSNLTLNGPGANLLTVRRDPAAADFRIFNIGFNITGGVAISGMTITGGRAGSGSGGGILSLSNLTLTGLHVTGNQADAGGGVELAFGDGVFTGCTFSNNTATFTGGFRYFGSGGRTLRLVNSTVSGNSSASGGGGIINVSSSSSGTSRLEVTNSTIANNTAGGNGGGIRTLTQNGANNTATTTLRNTIIAGNTPNNLAAETAGGGATMFQTLGFNLASDNGGGFLNVAPITTDKINAFAGLAPLGDNGGPTLTHALLGSSAALDAGNNASSGVLTDQRGGLFRRTVDLPMPNFSGSDGTDIGAFEAQAVPATPSFSINDVTQNEGNAGASNFTFTVTLSAANAQSVSVVYTTSDGTATAPSDYTAIPQTTLTFAPGETSKAVNVSVNGDTTLEPNETFFVNLLNNQGALISDGQGIGTIVNDDVCPTITVSPATLPSGTVGVAYSQTVSGSGGALPYSFAVSAGTLPTGLTLAATTGILSGTPTTNGSFNFALTATDANGCPGNKSYSVVVSAPSPSPSPTASPTPSPSPSPTPATLGNISTRLRVEAGDNVLIGGFIVTGTQPKRVIIRAIGPSLPVAGKLADPTLELVGPGGVTIASNDNWRTTQQADIIASQVPPTNDLESAIVATLAANSTGYTAIMRGAGGTTGVGLVEVYDLDRTTDSQLANISTRGFVQSGDNVMIGGFIPLGGVPRRVIVRAIGPSLPVAGKLADPTLELFNANGASLGANDNWRTGGQQAEIIASQVPTDKRPRVCIDHHAPRERQHDCRGERQERHHRRGLGRSLRVAVRAPTLARVTKFTRLSALHGRHDGDVVAGVQHIIALHKLDSGADEDAPVPRA